MQRQLKSVLLLCASIFFISTLFAQSTEKKPSAFRFLVGAAIEFGGEDIAEVYYTNGEKEGVPAGQGGSIALGGQYRIPGAEKFLLRSTIGFKYITTAADNVHIRLTRIPIVVSGNYMATSKLRLSAGLTSHQNIRFKTGGLGGDAKFKAATGPIFEVAYAGFGLSYTAMKYKDQSNHSYSANAIGLTVSLTIPQ